MTYGFKRRPIITLMINGNKPIDANHTADVISSDRRGMSDRGGGGGGGGGRY